MNQLGTRLGWNACGHTVSSVFPVQQECSSELPQVLLSLLHHSLYLFIVEILHHQRLTFIRSSPIEIYWEYSPPSKHHLEWTKLGRLMLRQVLGIHTGIKVIFPTLLFAVDKLAEHVLDRLIKSFYQTICLYAQ